MVDYVPLSRRRRNAALVALGDVARRASSSGIVVGRYSTAITASESRPDGADEGRHARPPASRR